MRESRTALFLLAVATFSLGLTALAEETADTIGIVPSYFAQALSSDRPIKWCSNNFPGWMDATVCPLSGSGGGSCSGGACTDDGSGITTYGPVLPTPVTGINSLPSTYPDTTRPGTPSGTISTVASVIDNATFSYVYDASDFRIPGGNPWANASVSRILRSRDMAEVSSFGPGFFCNYDTKLRFDSYGAVNLRSAEIFDPNRLYPQMVNLTEFYGTDGNIVEPNDFAYGGYNGETGEETAPDNNVARVLYQVPSGGKFYFDVIEVDNGGYAGRLARMEAEDGTGTTITYKTWTEQELAEAPDRQWQIDSVSGDSGVTLTFNYHAEQISGRWAVSQISVPAWGSVDYAYVDGRLAAVSHPDGTQSTFNWSVATLGAYSAMALESLAIFDPKATGSHRRKTVYWSTPTWGDQVQIFNQASQLVRYVTNGNDEVVYLAFNLFPNARIYEGEGVLKRVNGTGNVQYEKRGWEFHGHDFGEDDMGMGYFNVQTSVTSVGLDRGEEFLIGNSVSLTGTPSVITDDRGISRTLEYTGGTSSFFRNIKKTTYGDETYETWEHDDFGRVLRYRDRMARVTKYTYDSSGRRLTKEVGILELEGPEPTPETGTNPPDDDGTGETTTGGEVSYNAGYDAGYNSGYDDGYFGYGYADYSNSTDPDFVTGFGHGYYDGNGDGGMDYYEVQYMGSTDYPGSYWQYSYGYSQFFQAAGGGSSDSEYDPYYDAYYDDSYSYEDYESGSGGYADYMGGGPVEFHDALQPEYAVYTWEYYPAGHANSGLLKTEYDPLWDGSSADVHRTDYEYDANGNLTKKLGPASVTGGDRPETNYTYDGLNRLATVISPAGHLVTYTYNASNQRVRTTYDDGSTEETLYGAVGGGNEGLVVKTKDRRNVVTEYAYDLSGRQTQVTVATAWDADILDGNPDDTPITDRNEQSITTFEYQNGTNRPIVVRRDGAKSDYVYDHRGRVVETKSYPYVGKTLVNKVVYENNQKQFKEDPYGRREYFAYRASDGAMVRRVREAYAGMIDAEIEANSNEPAYSTGYDAGYGVGYDSGFNYGYDDPTTYDSGNTSQNAGYVAGYYDGQNDGYSDMYDGNFQGTYWMSSHGSSFSVPPVELNPFLLALLRDEDLNPRYVVKDLVQDAGGATVQVIDERAIQHDTEVDTRGQAIRETQAVGTPVEAITETDYDAAGNVLEVRTPRYFDPNDTNGFEKCRTVMTYDGANRVLTRTEAPGTPEAGTESYAYDSSGRQISRTDARGKVWTTTYASCCGHSVASTNPLGHGSITNQDNGGLVVHAAGISDVASHVSLLNPDDTKTLQETTTRYDALGRSVASCTWLVPQGLIEAADPPVAGFGGISGDDGLTTQTLYDVDLTDGVGLDSATGISVTNPLGGTYNVSLTAALTKLAEPTAQGGAGITFDATTPGSAVVNLNAENEVSFSISDAQGRSVMSGILQPHDAVGAATPGELLTWSCQVHDTIETVDNKTFLTSISVDALGHTSKARSNGLGHTLQSIDQEGSISTVQYDAGGNAIISRDPNNVGYDAVYDALNRSTSQTDTVGSVTQSIYDKAGQQVQAIDAKNKPTNYVYNARGQRTAEVDRLGFATHWAYDAGGNLLSLTDAEAQTTSYTYNDAGQRITEQYPDHIAGAVIGDAGYGIITFTYDALGRRTVKEDQQGDTTSYNFDMSGRMLTRVYVGHPTSPLAGQTDTDTFTYDRNGRMLSGIKGRYNNTVTFSYDDRGQQIQETLTTHGQTYTLGYQKNELGQTTQLQYPDGSLVDRDYTPRGQLLSVDYAPAGAAASSDVADFVYDTGGRETTRNLGNGLATSRSYFADNQIQSIATPTVEDLTYTYDANKNPTSETRSGVMAPFSWSTGSMGFDDEDRLTNWSRTNGASQTWNLSPVHDWTSTTVDGSVQSRTHGLAHEIQSMSGAEIANGSASPTFDTKGNMTTDDRGTGMTWDFDNMMQQFAANGVTSLMDATYEYDAVGRRIFKSLIPADAPIQSTVFVHADQRVICEYSASSQTANCDRKFAHGTYIDDLLCFVDATTSEESRYWPHQNRQWSTYSNTSQTGQIDDRYSYSANGDFLRHGATGVEEGGVPSSLHNILFLGRMHLVESRLWYFRSRDYSSTFGRFLTRDKLRFVNGNNEYGDYFGLKFVDPTGTQIYPNPALPYNCQSTFCEKFPTEKDYVKSRCWLKCGIQGEFGGNAETLAMQAQELANAFEPDPSEFPDDFFGPGDITDAGTLSYASREHSALRHCIWGGLLAASSGCGCSMCVLDSRDFQQYKCKRQSETNTRQAFWNDGAGRECAGCTGKLFNKENPPPPQVLPIPGRGGIGGPGVSFPPRRTRSKKSIFDCCVNKLKNGELATDNGGPSDLNNRYPLNGNGPIYR